MFKNNRNVLPNSLDISSPKWSWWAKIKVLIGYSLFQKFQELLENICIPWLMVPSSILKVHDVSLSCTAISLVLFCLSSLPF